MRNVIRSTLAIGAAVIVAACPVLSSAAEPQPAKPTTWHEYRDGVLALNRRTLSGAYQQVGTRGKWDADAVKFLDRMAVYFSCANLNWVYLLPKEPAPSHQELIAAGQALTAAGCTDPIVRYCLGVALHDSGNFGEAMPIIRQVVPELQKAGYPPARVAAAAARMRRLEGSGPGADAMVPIIREHRLKSCSGKLDDIERRVAVEHTWAELFAGTRAEQQLFVDTLRKRPDADPWVLNVLDGRLQIKLAWDARGSGFANTVTEEGWKGFSKHLTAARDSLVAAYKLAPHLPEPSIEMITVSMGAGHQLGESQETWLDRALAAQLDHAEAYGRMLNALLPRWGGDFAQIYDLGIRGVTTNRYDTIAPWQFVRAVQTISKDTSEGWQMVLQQEGVYDAIAEVCEKYEAHGAKIGRDSKWYTTYHAAMAWRAGRYADARKQLEKAADKLEPEVFRQFGSQDPPAAIGHAYAMSGPHAAEAKQGEAAFKEQRYADAVKIFKTIAAAPDVHAREKPYLEARVRLADRRDKFARGEWIDIQPAAGLGGWTAASGAWRIAEDDGRLHAQLEPGGRYTPSLVCTESFGTRVEFAGVLEPWGPAGANPGVCLGNGTHPAFFASVGQGTITLFGNGFQNRIASPALDGINGPASFVMTYDNGRLSLTINGNLVVDKHQVPPKLIRDPHVGVFSGMRGASRFSELKVRRMPEPGEAPAKPAGNNDGFD